MSTRNNGLIKQLIKIFFTVFLDLRDNSFLKNETLIELLKKKY